MDTAVLEEEIKIHELLGICMTMFAELPVEHPADIQDFVYGIHLLQNIVLSRVGLRVYKAL